jgi:hypothetical protein
MKRSALVLGLLCLGLNSYGQRNIWKVAGYEFFMNDGIDLQANQLQKEKDQLKKNNILSREKTHYNHGKKYVTTQTFNTNGQITEISRLVKGKASIIKYSYDSDDKMTLVESINSKGEKWVSKYLYDTKRQIIERETINHKGKYNGVKIKYNLDGKIVSKAIYKEDRLNSIKSLEYTFYEDGSKKSTIFKAKGKVKYEWHFDCKAEGELLNVKNKDQSTICIKEETEPNGNKIVWTREFNEKGALTKTKKAFKNDRIWVDTQVFDENDQLLNQTSLKTDGGHTSVQYKKGKQISSYETFVNKNNQQTKSISTYKKSYSTHLYKYANSIKTLEVRMYNRQTYVDEYIYTFH